MKEVIKEIEESLKEVVLGNVWMPPRISTKIENNKGWIGIMPCYIKNKNALGTKIVSDYPDNKIKPGEIVVGNGLAQELKIEQGDTVFLQVFSSRQSSPFPRKIKPIMVKEIFHSGLQEYDKTLAYVHLDDARNLFGFENNFVSGMILSNANVPVIRKKISYPYFYESWRDRQALLFVWIHIQRWPAYIMFGLIALVGIVNIIAAIAMIITEKSGQIGILMAQGTHRSTLKSIFMIQGGFIGLMGGIIGGLL